MVETTIAARGVDDPRVLEAMRSVPRHEFLPPQLSPRAYEDSALPIGKGQTISQPYIVALMAQALKLNPGAKVLEVGTGSGYSAAVLSQVAGEVYSIERHSQLATQAAQTLARLGFDRVHVTHGDGTLGWPEHAPYDAISVAAGGTGVPEPLLLQLAIGGRLVIPLGPQDEQTLTRIIRTGESSFEREDLGGVRFVPLIPGSPPAS
jgi:protein-L-isoaspartate(D-aspartate) O-methyltransferase